MIKKVLANILLNIAILTLAFSIVWSFKHEFYVYGVIGIFAIAMCVYLKIRLVKSVRELTKKHK